ncbi:hypothetical protein DAC20_155 [Bacteroides phage DAC20]|nr:hypothetical protein DAC16_150 [Bacteroides phage DAC16]QIG63647.1 hypothetical protein DAC19_156 [Bacteroides phage DAC19]QIG63908.1 hypothetical protein DAC20_155 [Bacteroides phage DAC20]QIG64172.1 hypothetical protein DAC22_158 [Bacteroides phage DAC22]QIG64428.1 hypothetical protein DAC23_150 [Bacteroides phage DAC23]
MKNKDFFEKHQDKMMFNLEYNSFCNIIGYDTKRENLLVIALHPNEGDLVNFEDVLKRLEIFETKGIYNIDKQLIGFIKTPKDIQLCNIDDLTHTLYEPLKNKFYSNFYSFFNDNSIFTRNGKQLNLSYCLKEYVGSIIIEQEKNQKNKNLFYLYIKFKNKEIEDIFQAEDMFKFVLDISNSDISRLEEIVEILSSKEKLLLEAFLNNDNYYNIIKDALAYRYLGLVENKIKRKETEVLEKFFKELNVQISIDDKGNLVYNKMYF